MKGTLKNLIKRGIVTNANTDTLQYPRTQVRTLAGERFAEELYSYGSFGVAPVGSLSITFSIMGEEENLVALTYNPQLRPVSLKVGEYACGNFAAKNYFKFNADGTVKLTTPQGAVISTDVLGNITLLPAAGFKTIIGDAVFSGANSPMNSTTPVIIQSAVSVSVIAPIVSVTAATSATVTSPTVDLLGTVNLGVGGAAIARLGDTVAVSTLTGLGTITSGSATHKAS